MLDALLHPLPLNHSNNPIATGKSCDAGGMQQEQVMEKDWVLYFRDTAKKHIAFEANS